MTVRDEINKYASEQDKDALLWLLDRYHRQSQWQFVAKCRHVQHGEKSYHSHRVWSPTPEGMTLYRAWRPVTTPPDLKLDEMHLWLTSGPVLAHTRTGNILVATLDQMLGDYPATWYSCCSERWDLADSVTHWMPLPQPPTNAEVANHD